VRRLGAGLRAGLRADSAADAAEARHGLPSSPAALRLYAEGLAALHVLDGQAAVRILQRAAELEPDSPLVHAALAEAWTNLGSDRRARQEAEKAFEISSSLGDEERNWIEGRYREAMQDWPRAIRVYGELRGAYPDNCEYGLRLAGAQRSLSAPGDALVTLA